MKVVALFLIFFLTSPLHADVHQEEFKKQILKMIGHYQVDKNSHTSCSGGKLSFVQGDFNKGIHLGHHVFFGPFSGQSEQDEGYCRVEQKFTFSRNQLKQETTLSKCPEKYKDQLGTTTKVLTLKDQTITYQIMETNFTCHFRLQKGSDL